MLKHIDRLMVWGYFKSYIICLVSLLTLYIVVDLFTNLDDFVSTNSRGGLPEVVMRIVSYYGYRVPQFFDRLCEAIVLLAAMFTVAMMQRSNEQIPLLSSGVPTQRIVAPVILSAGIMLTLTVLNQELLIPRIGPQLAVGRDDPGGEKEISVRNAYEPNLIHIEGERAVRKTQIVRNFRCTIPENVAGNLVHIVAQQARFIPDEGEPTRGRWELTGCDAKGLDSIPNVLDVTDERRCTLHTRSVDFETLTRDKNWFTLASTRRLYEELQRPDSTRLAAIAVLFHSRLTRPLLGLVLVLMGLGVILRDQNRNVIISAGLCLVLCAVFFASCHACKMLGDYEYLTPALAAWLPVLVFGPFAIVMFDAVHT